MKIECVDIRREFGQYGFMGDPLPPGGLHAAVGDAAYVKGLIEQARVFEQARIGLARTDYNECAEYVLRDEATGNPLRQAWLHEMWTEVRRKHKRAIIIAHVEAGKAMPLDTPIATPSGWVPIGELRPGDTVFDRRGDATCVRGVSPVHHDRVVYELMFDDGATIRADADHQWTAWNVDDLAAGRDPRVVTTEEMSKKIKRGVSWFWKVPLAGPVTYPHAQLPVHPYTLGVWLGDGDTQSGSIFTCDYADRAVVERIGVLEGLPVRQLDTVRWTVGDGRRSGSRARKLRTRLRKLGVLGAKHIPGQYLQASIDQRMELLRGLLDSDGSIDARGTKSRIEFTNTNKRLAIETLELARSLGFKASLREGVAKLNGREISPKYRVTFTANRQVFWLPRKAGKVRVRKPTPQLRHRSVVSIREVQSVPVRCISVDSPDSTFLAGKSYTVTHNTQQFSVGVPMFELGLNPRGRYAVVSRTQGQSVKAIRATAGYIEKSEELRKIFPNLRPGKKWSEKGYQVVRPDGIKEPSLAAFGIDGAITGARLDGVILDDVLDSTNTRTKLRRDEVEGKFFAEIFSRLTEDAWCYFIGNAWHPDDLYHRLEAQGWPTYRFPVQVTNETLRDFPVLGAPKARGGYGLALNDPTWPEQWSKKRVEERRQVVPPIEFARSMMCVARDDKDARFKREWLDTALSKGDDFPLCHDIEEFLRWDDPVYDTNIEYAAQSVRMSLDPHENEGLFWFVTGVDVSTGDAKDLTALTSVAVDRVTGKRFLLDCTAGRWQIDEIVTRIKDTYNRYGSIFMVENNATQKWLVQILNLQTAIPTVGYTTGRQKSDPEKGVEVLATEFVSEKWVIPSKGGEGLTENIQELMADMLYYSPDPRAHTGDRLMSLWFAQVLASRLERQSAYYNGDSGGGLTII